MKPTEICTHIHMSEMRGTSKAELIEMLKDQNVTEPGYGTYPIHEAALVNKDIIDFLVELGANVDCLNSEGYTPLAIAIGNNQVENVATLLRHNARLDIVDRLGNTPLLSAIIRGPKGYKIAEMLFEAGCEPDVKNVNGISAKSLAKEINHPLAERM